MIAPAAETTESRDGLLADNIVHFARALRTAGLRIGPGAAVDAILAVKAIGVGDREAFKAALRATLVSRREDMALFDEMFSLFWISPEQIRKIRQLMGPLSPRRPKEQKANPGRTRASNALMDSRRQPREERPPDMDVDARFTTSSDEMLRSLDFEQMSLAEMGRARKAMEKIVLPADIIKTRRHARANSGRIDPKATMRTFLRSGGELMLPSFRQRREIQPPLVVLADISGSMSQYTRIFLHFVHLLTARRRRVSTFLFGTRLTNVTRSMRLRDPDAALDACTEQVRDWSGGTRIGTALRDFNRLWSRRVLGQRATVLLLTDGLERDDIESLEMEVDRLHRSCRRLVWLNPLLRFDGFEARASGIKAMLPHVDDFRPVHNLTSLADLVHALSGKGSTIERVRRGQPHG
ncbi:MAG: VWA domain-containing protein [Rhizobium sp.]|nr:VWA domain-containing protein [Rhizobium sp.]